MHLVLSPKETRRLVKKRTSGDHPNYIIIKIGQNTAKSPGDLRRLAVTQIPVEGHQLMLVRKTFKGVNNDNDNNKSETERKQTER